jgi:hypothetical protein
LVIVLIVSVANLFPYIIEKPLSAITRKGNHRLDPSGVSPGWRRAVRCVTRLQSSG